MTEFIKTTLPPKLTNLLLDKPSLLNIRFIRAPKFYHFQGLAPTSKPRFLSGRTLLYSLENILPPL